MRKKIIIGMSGGIDSSVAAYILKKEYKDVIGITLKLWDNGSRCCDLKDVENAQRFAAELDIPHYVIDLRKDFKEKIIDYFIKSYLSGNTPNPCVICNKVIKFQYMYKKMSSLKFDYISTGHYANIDFIENNPLLCKADDTRKSQEYFLARVDKHILSKIKFPLAKFKKSEVKEIAGKLGNIFRKTESQDMCFLGPNEPFYKFILKHNKITEDISGKIVDTKGQILGETNCYFKYTIGQRKNLGISSTQPYYVIKIDPDNRRVIIGKRDEVYNSVFTVKDIYWYKDNIDYQKIDIKVKIRYAHKETDASISRNSKNNDTIVELKNPQHAVTPGQLAVFYYSNYVIGSGWIDKVIK